MITGNDFIGALRSFDSHERGILLQWATGADFALSVDLRQQLGGLLALDIPERAFVAMDYTLDWLYAAMRLFAGDELTVPQPWPADDQLKASIEDVDLLIAWHGDQPRLLLLEAKGFTGWSNKQLLSKVKRIDTIFDAASRHGVDVHLVLVGPAHSTGVDTSTWPAWLHNEGRYHFLQIPDPGLRHAVRRCTSAGVATSAQPATHWQVVQRKWG